MTEQTSAPPAATPIDTPLSGETNVPSDSSGADAFEGLGFDEMEIPADALETASATPPSLPTPSPASATPSTAPKGPSEPPVVPSGTQPPPAPQQPPQAQAPAPAEAGSQVPPAPAPTAGAPTPEPASIPSDPESIRSMLESNATAVIEQLASQPQFALSAEEATAIETDPARAIPRMMARTYYQSVNATLAYLNNLVPGMIDKHMRAVQLQNEAEEAFYGKFPTLDRKLHASDVMSFARMFKQQNPNMSKEDFFAMVGAAVMAKHGLMGRPNGANGAPPQQQVPPVPAFSPASPGASVRTVPVEEHPFMGLGREWDD